MLCEIACKKKHSIQSLNKKKYMKNSEELENYLKEQNYTPIQTQQILVKDCYKTVKQESTDWKVFLLGENQITTN